MTELTEPNTRPRQTNRWIRRVLLGVAALTAVAIVLFTINGLWLAHGETVATGRALASESEAGTSSPRPPRRVKVMAWNIAKCFVHRGGVSFDDEAAVRGRLEAMAALLEREQPDLVFLSEAVFTCAPCPVNQVQTLADASGLEYWAFGENYNFGLPFYRMSGGNAILSRFPLAPLGNPDLPGRQPFWITKNNRRALWCRVTIDGQTVRACSIHTDSFDPANNAAQTKAILEFAGDEPAMLAGDFNARRDDPSIQMIEATQRFITGASGATTFPGNSEEIDFIFAPRDWRVISYDVIPNDVSDHCPVVAVFELP